MSIMAVIAIIGSIVSYIFTAMVVAAVSSRRNLTFEADVYGMFWPLVLPVLALAFVARRTYRVADCLAGRIVSWRTRPPRISIPTAIARRKESK